MRRKLKLAIKCVKLNKLQEAISLLESISNIPKTPMLLEMEEAVELYYGKYKEDLVEMANDLGYHWVGLYGRLIKLGVIDPEERKRVIHREKLKKLQKKKDEVGKLISEVKKAKLKELDNEIKCENNRYKSMKNRGEKK